LEEGVRSEVGTDTKQGPESEITEEENREERKE
jgi:hypothetical protein